jgi:uncharacterized repeat protein (TIGR03803 family)
LAELVQGSDGRFYGTTSQGGLGYGGTPSSGDGTVFQIGPDGMFKTLVYFRGTNGSTPAASLVEGADGKLYGTTEFGGRRGDNGTVYSATPQGVLSTLFSFGGQDGNFPRGKLTLGGDGNFYGTTSGDRLFGGTNTFGTIFRITPSGALSTLLAFNGADGASPVSGLTRGNDGNLYGTTFERGPSGGGTIFRLVQPPQITLSRSNRDILLRWGSFTNGIYRIEQTATLTTPNWIVLSPEVTASGNITSTTIGLGTTHGYYRIRLMP